MNYMTARELKDIAKFVNKLSDLKWRSGDVSFDTPTVNVYDSNGDLLGEVRADSQVLDPVFAFYPNPAEFGVQNEN